MAYKVDFTTLDPIMTPKGAVQKLHLPVSDRKIRRMLEAGLLRGKRIGSRWYVSTESVLEAFGLIGGNVNE